MDVARQNLLIHLHRILGVEGRSTGRHLVDQHAEGPVVDGPIMALVEDDLGSEVVGSTCTAQSPKLAILDPLGQAEIHYLQIAVAIHNKVLWLEIAVGNLAGVDLAKGQDDRGGIESPSR